jgi:hypothetical protein
MSLLIPGPTFLGKDFDLFLEPLIDKLQKLWKGVKTFHVLHLDEDFTLRAAVLWCIHDFLALSTLSGRTTKGYYACIYCDKNPLSRKLRKKLGYLGHHRFLPRNHSSRKSLDFDGKTKDRDELEKFVKRRVVLISRSDCGDCEGFLCLPCGRSQKATLVDCSWLVDPHLVLVVWHPVAG